MCSGRFYQRETIRLTSSNKDADHHKKGDNKEQTPPSPVNHHTDDEASNVRPNVPIDASRVYCVAVCSYPQAAK